MPKREIYLIRHGATVYNAESGGTDRIRGWLNVDLSKEGRREADKIADQLAGSGIKVIVSSDLKRAVETAEKIAATTGATLYKDGNLRPWNLGKFTGQESTIAAPQIKIYAKDKPHQAIPGGGESFNSFRQRAFKGMVEAMGKAKGDGTLAVVSHYRLERLIKSWIDGGENPDGSLDWATFGKKGEKTAHFELMNIDLDKLRKAAARGGKQTKAEVNYREGTSSRRCDQCTMWQPPSGCTAVEGTIKAGDLCDLFESK